MAGPARYRDTVRSQSQPARGVEGQTSGNSVAKGCGYRQCSAARLRKHCRAALVETGPGRPASVGGDLPRRTGNFGAARPIQGLIPRLATPHAGAKTGARRHGSQSGRRLQGRPYSPPLIMTAPERTLSTPGGTVIPPALAWRRAGHPEAGSRVPVVGVVPVAAAGADVPRIVIARTAAHHTPAGGRPGFRLMAGAASIAGADRTDRKIGWRERHISHGAAGTTMSGTGLLVATNRVSIPVYLTQPPTPAP